MIKIALIDSGIDSARKEIVEKQIEHINTFRYCKDKRDNIEHGTAIAYLLQKNISDLQIVSFKLFEKNCHTDEEELIETLRNINETYVDIKMIHISCGITYVNKHKQLEEICEKLERRNVFIVSAFDNNGSVSFPAVYHTVIGVYWDKYISKADKYFYIENADVNILGYCGRQRLPWAKNEYKYVSGSSFTAPYITARVAEILEQNCNLSLEQLKRRLKEFSAKTIKMSGSAIDNVQVEMSKQIDKIKKAIVFPFNKEVHALVANEDLLKFEIVGLYDIGVMGNVNKNVASFLYGEGKKQRSIQSYEKIIWDSNFDTIIVGHLDIVNSVTSFDYIADIFQKCIKYGKSVFFFDNVSKYSNYILEMQGCGNQTMSHIVPFFSEQIWGSLYKIATPVLGVVGTSSKQGKYNLQLMLRRRFLEEGYRIGQLGTEPSAKLFGMDIVFSNGYGNTYKLTDEEEISYINKALWNIRNKDIILVGTQSHTIPYSFGNLGFLTTHQHNILVASDPDRVILCVNYDDSLLYIERTISVLINYFQTKVIGIVVFPFYKEISWNITNGIGRVILWKEKKWIKYKLRQRFKIPVYINGNTEDIDKFYTRCKKSFQ